MTTDCPLLREEILGQVRCMSQFTMIPLIVSLFYVRWCCMHMIQYLYLVKRISDVGMAACKTRRLSVWDNAFRGYLSVRWELGVIILRDIAEATYKHDKATA